MLINAHFDGLVERLILAMQKNGIAKTKAEAIRILALDYSNRYPNILAGQDWQILQMDRMLEKEKQEMGALEAERMDARLDALNEDLLRRGVLTQSEFRGKRKVKA